MTLRHAVLVALLGTEAAGYQLVKAFDVSVANFWASSPQQIYAELPKLEARGLIAGREVVQTNRPNKRVYTLTKAGRDEISNFIATASKPSIIRDDLVVKVFTTGDDARDDAQIASELDQRATECQARADLFTQILRSMLGDRTELEYLQNEQRIGPYLTCRRGQLFEQDNARYSRWTAEAIRARLRGQTIPGIPLSDPRSSISEATPLPNVTSHG
ncbi:PadR family transcriptional regulator [Nocardia sp. NPDC127606]|uniref:PadR family transcriptional regulator n=1 Tax=Nocardia sp. NPDC127606 TaxID=3345406 RepID=UPI003645505A